MSPCEILVYLALKITASFQFRRDRNRIKFLILIIDSFLGKFCLTKQHQAKSGDSIAVREGEIVYPFCLCEAEELLWVRSVHDYGTIPVNLLEEAPEGTTFPYPQEYNGCPFCKKRLSPSAYIHHIQYFPKAECVKEYNCTTCRKGFDRQKELDQHECEYLDFTSKDCLYGEHAATQRSSLSTHLRQLSCVSKCNSCKRPCPVCFSPIVSKSPLLNDMNKLCQELCLEEAVLWSKEDGKFRQQLQEEQHTVHILAKWCRHYAKFIPTVFLDLLRLVVDKVLANQLYLLRKNINYKLFQRLVPFKILQEEGILFILLNMSYISNWSITQRRRTLATLKCGWGDTFLDKQYSP